MIKNKILISRVLLGVSFLTLAVLAYFFYAPYVYASWWRQTGQAWAIVISTGAPLAFILVFTLIWPKPGGVIATLYGALQIWLAFASSPDYTIPSPVIAVLYMLFAAGGILSFLGAGPYQRVRLHNKLLSRILTTARFTAFIPMVYAIIRPSGILAFVPGIISALIANFWPGPGGVLMLFVAGFASYLLYESNWGAMLKLPGYIFCASFMLSGILHIFIAWRSRMYRDSGDHGVSES